MDQLIIILINICKFSSSQNSVLLRIPIKSVLFRILFQNQLENSRSYHYYNSILLFFYTPYSSLPLVSLSLELLSWFAKSACSDHWTRTAITITESWLNESLKPRCIARDLTQDTPVPSQGYTDSVVRRGPSASF